MKGNLCPDKMKKRYIFLIIGVFILLLIFLRIQWMHFFSDVSELDIQDGELVLQNWDMNDEDVLLLDGEWEFYPSQWIYDQDKSFSIEEKENEYIDVPNGWNVMLNGDDDESFGYGSYRLRIQVPEDKGDHYSLYVPSVRSASEVYVNGRLMASSGEVGVSKDSQQAKNLPYTTTFMADEDGEIEVVVQASNFQDIRRSGIIRSIKFGLESAILKERNLSFAMQIIASALLLIHAIYALALYFLGNRDNRLIFFTLFLISVTLMNLVSTDDKLFHLLFNISYEWDFRLANMVGPIAAYSLFRCLDRNLIPYWKVINSIFLFSNIILGLVIVFSMPSQIISLLPANSAVFTFAIVLAIYVLGRRLYIDIAGNLLLLLSFLAIVHNLAWMMYWRERGISVVYYPFDFMIAVGLFSLIWFKNYFSIHAGTKQLATELQEMNEYKSQFLANTSHEFRNPLHGIINMSESVLLREEKKLERRSVQELESVLTVGKRMSLLLNDLLDAENLKEGTPRLTRNNLSVQPIIQGVVDILGYTVDMKDVQIINHISDDFPAVYADENRVTQVFYNLLHNAIKFTDEGDIYIQANVKDGYAYIDILDQGKGIDKAFLKRLFLPYEQVEREELVDSGLGLGLAISKQLVELHGGELEVVSIPEVGSTFTVSLPLATTSQEADVSKEEITNALFTDPLDAAYEKETHTMRPVLVVDDDPINLQVLESVLSVEDYEVITALSGKEAIEKLNMREWNLIITDVMMPYMSGYELTKQIRQRYSMTELPILLITARDHPEDIQTGFLVGANDYVIKPVERIELLSRVKALTSLKESVREQLHLEAIWLQSQIQPHFLFNTLNSLVALSEIDVERMKKLLIDFSEFLKSKYHFHHITGIIPLEEELLIIESYLAIEQVRFGDRLEVEWNVDVVERVDVPFLSIQPLVENAVNHGVMERIEGGKITISTIRREDGVLISVSDNGVGMDDAKVRDLLNKKTDDRSSVGLINTNSRIQRHFGQGLYIQSGLGEGTTVSFLVTH